MITAINNQWVFSHARSFHSLKAQRSRRKNCYELCSH